MGRRGRFSKRQRQTEREKRYFARLRKFQASGKTNMTIQHEGVRVANQAGSELEQAATGPTHGDDVPPDPLQDYQLPLDSDDDMVRVSSDDGLPGSQNTAGSKREREHGSCRGGEQQQQPSKFACP